MMTRMPDERVVTAGPGGRLASVVNAYARRVGPSVLEQHPRASVSSPLGIWLLLAACAGAAEGAELASLEEALGCSGASAGQLLADFMAAPPPALKAAIAVWARAGDATDALAAWVRGLPPGIQSGFMPTPAEADAWAERETLGLIRSFPVRIDELTRVVLASALATRVSWEVPFSVVPASAHLAAGSPWAGKVERLLWDGLGRGGDRAMIARTATVGLVAVHCAAAREDLTVVSVSADPGVERAAVLAAAHELAPVAVAGGDGWSAVASSLYDLPLGSGHSWEIAEEHVPTYIKESPLERIAGAALPAWSVRGELDLAASPAFATRPALETLRRLIGPGPDDECDAAQTAIASFTRYGFEAAAVTAMAVRASAARLPVQRTLQRSAVLRYDHPYAAVAVAGRPVAAGGARSSAEASAFPGLPLFTVWVHEPREPEDRPPST